MFLVCSLISVNLSLDVVIKKGFYKRQVGQRCQRSEALRWELTLVKRRPPSKQRAPHKLFIRMKQYTIQNCIKLCYKL